MSTLKFGAVLAALVAVSGCQMANTPGERALAGGLAGALVGDATDNTVATTAAIGALAGMASCGVAGMPPCQSGY